MNKYARLLGTCAVRALTVCAFFAGAELATASAQTQYPTIQNNHPSGASQYWTQDRLDRAKPRDIWLPGTHKPPTTLRELSPTGTPGAAGGKNSNPAKPYAPLQQSLLDQLKDPPQPSDGPYPGPHTTYQIAAQIQEYTDFPYSAIGKLFFTEQGVGDFVCSGTVTFGDGSTPARRSKLWTAGHCVADGGKSKFFTNFRFCPAYNNGPDPIFGCWDWASVTTTPQWFANGAYTKDYAGVTLQQTGTTQARPIADVVGAYGFAWNWPRDQHFAHLGYPQEAPYTGLKMIRTDAEYRYSEIPDLLGPPTNSWGSAQTRGSSGSGVFLNWSYTGGNLISLVSYSYDAQFGHELYGPYHDTSACIFWKNFTAWPGTC